MIFEELKSVIAQLDTDAFFVYGDEFYANIESDAVEHTKTYIVLDVATNLTGRFTKAGVLQDTINLSIGFFSNYNSDTLYHTELDDANEQLDQIQKRCLELARTFLNVLVKDFDLIDRANTKMEQITYTIDPVQFVYDANFHGVLLRVSIPVVIPLNYCIL